MHGCVLGCNQTNLWVVVVVWRHRLAQVYCCSFVFFGVNVTEFSLCCSVFNTHVDSYNRIYALFVNTATAIVWCTTHTQTRSGNVYATPHTYTQTCTCTHTHTYITEHTSDIQPAQQRAYAVPRSRSTADTILFRRYEHYYCQRIGCCVCVSITHLNHYCISMSIS